MELEEPPRRGFLIYRLMGLVAIFALGFGAMTSESVTAATLLFPMFLYGMLLFIRAVV